MSRHLSVASVIDKNKVSSRTPWVILLEINVTDPNTREVVEVIRIAKNTENVIFGQLESGEPRIFTAGNFSINVEQRQNEAPSVSISAQDQTRYIEQRMEDEAGGVFSEVTMLVVNTDRLDKPAEIEETFQITNSGAKNYVASFSLGSENPLGIQFPKSNQWKDRCTWRFRGYGCGYTGTLKTCDYTKDGPNGCLKHFKGKLPFRGLPGLVRMNV